MSIATAIRMADEGIPVRVIARATQLPSSEIYETLRDAINKGLIVAMPRDEWPPGSTRGSRFPFAATILEDDEALKIACALCFKTTPLEASIFICLLRRKIATRDQLHTAAEQGRPGEHRDTTQEKIIDVVICKLRKKLARRDILIDTVWATGYTLTGENRLRAQTILKEFAADHTDVIQEQLPAPPLPEAA